MSHEDHMINAYVSAINKMKEIIEYMSDDNIQRRLDNLSCNETCSSSGQGDGCKDSTCTCACLRGSDAVAASTQSYSTRNYNICTDPGVSDWEQEVDWSCTIRDQNNPHEWWE